MNYRKIGPNHPAYERVQAMKQAGQWVCDAVTHNSPRGCSNPDCYNYTVKLRHTNVAP